jgi:hypothetical protein
LNQLAQCPHENYLEKVRFIRTCIGSLAALRQTGFRLFSNRTESFRIMHRDIREHFAVYLDLSQIQTIDQAAIGQSVQTSSRIDARDPQCAELALALTTIPVGVLAGLDNGLLGGLE